MNPRRVTWLAVALASFGGAIGSGVLMAQRIRGFHDRNPREVFVFRRVMDRQFNYAGRPVRIEDDNGDPIAPAIVLRYGEGSERIPVTVPGNAALPDLLPHENWLRVLRMASATRVRPREFLAKLDAGEIPDRLIVVARVPQPGADPSTWGDVWKHAWSFDFWELTPDGAILKHERLKYPSARGLRQPRPGELHENTWQFQAALQTMPQAGAIGPTHNFFGNALAAAGWTLPASAFCGLGATLALAAAFAPERRRAGAGAPAAA
ncbi:MAG TPA: hypothetical protein VD971_08330 [Phycisphaerales bacterium]|nr:hypothetical protein [Phycisphaerales bacterium]